MDVRVPLEVRRRVFVIKKRKISFVAKVHLFFQMGKEFSPGSLSRELVNK